MSEETDARVRVPREVTREALAKDMWRTMQTARRDKQHATASLTGERIAKMMGLWNEKAPVPAGEGEAQREVVVFSAEPMTDEEWAREFSPKAG